MKNRYLKTGILLIGITLLLWNCKSDDELIILENEIVTNSIYKVPEILKVKSNFEAFETKHKIFNKNLKSTASKGNSDIYIDWDNSKKYNFKVDENIDILYTPIIYNKKGYRMKSLLASVEIEGIIESFIFTLIFDETSTNNKFSGLIYRHDVEGNFVKVYKYSNGKKICEGVLKTNSSNSNKNTSNRTTPNDIPSLADCFGGLTTDDLIWMAEAGFELNNLLNCVEITYTSGSSESSNDTSWYDPDLNLWSNTPLIGSNIISTANTSGSSSTNTQTTNIPSSTTPIDDTWYSEESSAETQFAIKVIKSSLTTLSNDQINWVNNINNAWKVISIYNFLKLNNFSTDSKEFAYLTIDAYDNSGYVNYVDRIIIDKTLLNYPCHYGVVESAYGVCSPLTQLILDAFESNENTNLIFNTNNNIPSTSNGGTSTITVNNLNTNTCYLTVTIRESYLTQATDLSIARTVIHESLHAVLVHMLERGDFVLQSGNADTGYEYLVEEYIKYSNGFPNNIGMAHHELMTNYVESIASSLSVYGNNNGHSNSFNYYKRLAWGGLQNTPTFKTLYPKYINPNDETNNPNNVNPEWLNIINTIAVETENLTYIFEHPNGNTYEFNPKGNTPNATTPCN